MSGCLNEVALMGHLGRDPEVRATQDGRRIANLSLATSETWKDKATGEKRERTEWHRVVIFNDGLAGIAERFLSKGSKVYLRGALRTRKWTDQEGRDRWTTEVVLNNFDAKLVLLGTGSGSGGGVPPADPADYGPAPGESGTTGAAAGTGSPAGGGGTGGGTDPDLDDDIPF